MKARVVVVAIVEKGNAILMGKKPKDRGPYPNTWVLPGGGVDIEHETLEDAMRREIKEETGIEVSDLVKLMFSEDDEKDKHGELTHYLFLTFQTQYKKGTLKPGDDISYLEWIDKKRLSYIPLARPSQNLFKKLGWL